MAFGNAVSITGNLTRDPELTYSQKGTAICRFGVAWNKFVRDGDDIPHYFDVTAFGQLGENVAESLSKGDRVQVDGTLDFSQWKAKDADGNETDENRSKVSILADEVGVNLRFATAAVTKNPKSGGETSPGPMPAGETAADAEPF